MRNAELKEDFRTCHIPVIILTALTSDEDIVKGTDLGADDYILKPFNPEVLRAKVKRLMRSRVELKQIYTKLLTSATPSSTHQDEEIIDATTTKVEDPLIEKIVELVKANLQNPCYPYQGRIPHLLVHIHLANRVQNRHTTPIVQLLITC